MTTLNISIADYGQITARTMAIARGEYRAAEQAPALGRRVE